MASYVDSEESTAKVVVTFSKGAMLAMNYSKWDVTTFNEALLLILDQLESLCCIGVAVTPTVGIINYGMSCKLSY